MKTTLQRLLFTGVILLSACQASPVQKSAAVLPTPIPVASLAEPAVLTGNTGLEISPTTAAAEPAAQPQEHPAAAAARSYSDTLQSGAYESAAGLLSSYSLMIEETTRSAAGDSLRARMAREKWQDFQVVDLQPFNDRTVLVRVTYQAETTGAAPGEKTLAQVDEQWPVRQEGGKWLVNFNRVIDFRTLTIPEQSTGGLTAKPRQLTRYADRIRLTLLVQNQTNEPIVLGQVNEIMAAFLFGEEQLEAEKAQFVFDRLRSYPDVRIEVKGQFDHYPDGVIIRQWKNVKAAPWFVFTFNR